VNRNASFVSREAYLVDDEPRMVFLTRYEQRFTNDDVLGYCSMRLFALSIRPLWHGVCVPAGIMAQGPTTFGALIVVGLILIFPYQVPAQQSTAPSSSLSTRPLAPGTTESELRTSCDLCRKPEGRPESDLRPQRLRREKGLRPHKNAKGTHRSFDQSIKSTLPRHPLVPPEDQGQRDSQARGPAK
jgi:hypothetical protein